MDAITLRRRMQNAGIDLVGAASLTEKVLAFERALRIVIPPKDRSDRTSFRMVTGRLMAAGRGYLTSMRYFGGFWTSRLRHRVRPAAVFTAIVKKGLGYSLTDSAHAVGEV